MVDAEQQSAVKQEVVRQILREVHHVLRGIDLEADVIERLSNQFAEQLEKWDEMPSQSELEDVFKQVLESHLARNSREAAPAL